MTRDSLNTETRHATMIRDYTWRRSMPQWEGTHWTWRWVMPWWQWTH